MSEFTLLMHPLSTSINILLLVRIKKQIAQKIIIKRRFWDQQDFCTTFRPLTYFFTTLGFIKFRRLQIGENSSIFNAFFSDSLTDIIIIDLNWTYIANL